MKLNLVTYCTILILMICRIDVVICPPTPAPVNRNPTFTPVAGGAVKRNDEFSIDDSDEELENQEGTSSSRAAPPKAGAPGGKPVVVGSGPVIKPGQGGGAQTISLAESGFEGAAPMPRPGGATPRPVGAQPVAAGPQVVTAPKPRLPPGAAAGKQPEVISLAESGFEGNTPMARPAGPAPRPAAGPLPKGPPKSEGISLAESGFEGNTPMARPSGPAPRPAGAQPIASQPPSPAAKSGFDEISLSEMEDEPSKPKFDQMELSGTEVKPSKTPESPKRAVSSGGFEDIALSETEGFDAPVAKQQEHKRPAFPPQKGDLSSGSEDYEEVPIESQIDFGDLSQKSRTMPKTKVMPGSRVEEISLSESGGMQDAMPGRGGREDKKSVDGDSIYEVKMKDREQPKRGVPERYGFIKPLKLVIDINNKWSTDEIEYKRDDFKRMDIFTAVNPHLIYRVKNFEEVLWEAKGDACCKVVDIQPRPGKDPLVRVFFPEPETRVRPERGSDRDYAVQEEQMSDYSGYKKFSVHESKLSDRKPDSEYSKEFKRADPDSRVKVMEMRPGAYDSDATQTDPSKPRLKHGMPGLMHLVVVDIKNKESTDKITYERQGDFDVFTAVEPYLIDKIQKRNELIWQSLNCNYASRVIQKKIGHKRNFKIFFPYDTAQCSDSGSEDERIRREVDEQFHKSHVHTSHATHVTQPQPEQPGLYPSQHPGVHPGFTPTPVYHPPHTYPTHPAHMGAHPPHPSHSVHPVHPAYQPTHPSHPVHPAYQPTHHTPPHYYKASPYPQYPQPAHHPSYYPGVAHPAAAHDHHFTVHDKYSSSYHPSHPKRRYRPSHHDFTQSPSDRWQDQRKRHHKPEEDKKHKKHRRDTDPLVEIVELYKVEEEELDDFSDLESPEFFKHLTLDIDDKETTTKYLYEYNHYDGSEIFTSKEPYLIGIVKKGDKLLWRSKDNRYSRKIILRPREGEMPLLRVFLPRQMTSTSKLRGPRLMDLDIRNKFSTNEYDYKFFYDKKPAEITKHVYTAKNSNKFNVVRRDENVIWRAKNEYEYSHQVVVLQYNVMKTEQVMIYMPDGSEKKYTRPLNCVNYYRNWRESGSVPLFSPKTASVALDINNKRDTPYYHHSRQGNISTFQALYGYVFTAVTHGTTVLWTSRGTEFSVKVELLGDYDLTIQLCDRNLRFRRWSDGFWYEYSDKYQQHDYYTYTAPYYQY